MAGWEGTTTWKMIGAAVRVDVLLLCASDSLGGQGKEGLQADGTGSSVGGDT